IIMNLNHYDTVLSFIILHLICRRRQGNSFLEITIWFFTLNKIALKWLQDDINKVNKSHLITPLTDAHDVLLEHLYSKK
ncbi:unnamed protein product, partial [Sphenostylis stenocarpa]